MIDFGGVDTRDILNEFYHYGVEAIPRILLITQEVADEFFLNFLGEMECLTSNKPFHVGRVMDHELDTEILNGSFANT